MIFTRQRPHVRRSKKLYRRKMKHEKRINTDEE